MRMLQFTMETNQTKQKDIYMTSGDWERERMPTYTKATAYCSMTGQDLEHDQQAWDEASNF